MSQTKKKYFTTGGSLDEGDERPLIVPIVKHVWNVAFNVLHNFWALSAEQQLTIWAELSLLLLLKSKQHNIR